ncbi:ABC transporter substrate-binding protein [Caldovatus sediminis]|uniref:ABC transporter substrate-binding protein n=1 Tax=Caldovatus sediminis TaxID=2041189 RepID=A0A8J2ZCB6_9PROT|nr:ABC transporter substrate-binding protein [Caldovatus sediminis]GGG36343.1 ABC transporter substrate-binding protein [Caldovatus sediminis]
MGRIAKRSLVAAVVAAGLTFTAGAGAQTTCEVRIGALGPMSGPAAQWGLAMLGAAELAAAEANARGGLQVGSQRCSVSVLSYDTRYTAEGAAAGVNNLASQGVRFLIGPVGSPEVTGAKPVATRHRLLMFANSYAKNAIGPQWPLVFHLGPGPSEWAPPIVRLAKEQFGMRSVAIVAPNDQGGTDIASVDAEVYRQHGITATEEYYQRGTTNFAPIVTRLLASRPDVVDTASSPPGDAGLIVRQLRQAGFTGPIGRLGGPGTEEIIRVAGGIDVVRNFYWYEVAPTEDPRVRAISDEYRRLLNREPPENTNLWLWVVGARMTLRAIERAGTATDTNRVAAALRELPVEDPNLGRGAWTGQSFFGINQELSLPFGMGMILDGRMVGVRRIDVSPQ